MLSTKSGEADYIRVKRKRTNVNYRKTKPKKRQTHVSIGYQEALITGNPQCALTRVEVGYDVGLGVSVYVKGKAFHKGDYVTHYAVKRTMTVEEYADIYTNKEYKPTPLQRRDTDYMYKFSKNEYWIGEYDDRNCERGIAKIMNCATPGTEERNNCELVLFTKDNKKWLVAEVNVLEVQEGEQLLTRYGGRKVVSNEYVDRDIPEDLRNIIQPVIKLRPPSAHGVVPTDYYGYSDDRLWEVKMELQGSRLVKCRQLAHALCLPDEAAITYLLALHADIFQLKIKSTDKFFDDTNGDGRCGYRAIWQAEQRASTPIAESVGVPVDIRYKDDIDRKARIKWLEGLVADLAPPANQSRLHTYIQ